METFLRAAQARATDAEARAPAWWSHRLPASARSRSMELVLVGQQVSRLLPSSSQRQFRALWRELVVPRALDHDWFAWSFGMTARIHGLTSAAAKQFNGLLGRISSHDMQDSRWELLVEGPDGVGTVNLRPVNLGAPSDCVAILRTARSLPAVVQVANGETAAPSPASSLLAPRPRAKTCEPCRAK